LQREPIEHFRKFQMATVNVADGDEASVQISGELLSAFPPQCASVCGVVK
jgi:hypothetical protein